MNQQSIEAALAGLPTGPLHFLSITPSTNDEAARLSDEGAPDLALVITDEQTAGRGRFGRAWYSLPGASLAFSLVLRPNESTTQLFSRYSALGTLAICNCLEIDYGLQTEIKWPNDILIEQRKVAGVLAEGRWLGDTLSAIILGIGVNVSYNAIPPTTHWIYPATSIEQALQRPVNRIELLRMILTRLIEWREEINQPEFISAWEERLAFRDEWVRLQQGDSVLEGKILGINLDGSLRLLDRGGRLFTAYAGDVSLRSSNME